MSAAFCPGRTRDHALRMSGFSLVEVTVAIGIFAFVVVAIIGMFPAAMKMRSESALETRAAMIAQELFSAVRKATNMTNVILRTGPDNAQVVSLKSDPVVVGYPSQTSVPFYFAGNPGPEWTNALISDAALQNDILLLARLSATNVTNNLYRVDVQVRSPAGMPLSNSTLVSFTTFQYKP